MKLYTKEFLHDLQEQMSKVSILDYLMCAQLKTFNEAIEEMATFGNLNPQEINRKAE